ncbi:hypothetical protein [Mucilaginibacter sp.]|uniref:hypothetical protein n=1 Tax=Mucilaginibacter sp. TaxID=1882438 RepID=UPI0026027E43|nr:hypothetical protein [Mucilaginibacter sp.]MDB4922259.1 hypothetical protein [Mucilaginibacter sp.]
MIELLNADEYRGYFISEFAKLERAIDLFIANYFIQKNPRLHNEIISVLIDRLSFDGKRTALKALLDLKYPKIENIHNSGKVRNFKKLLDEIGKSSRIRNYYAHYFSVDYSNFPQVAIALVQFRDSVNIIIYKKNEFDKQIQDINKSFIEVQRLKDELKIE